MTAVVLRDLVTDADRAAARSVRGRPGDERFVSSVDDSFRDAIEDARACPRMWTVHDAASGAMVGFAMISDDIPAETLAADADLIGPYYLWRLLIDANQQRRGYGTGTLDAVADYVRGRPGGDILWVSCGQEPGTPQPFYEGYGFVPTDRFVDGERVLYLDLTTEDR